MSAIRYVVMSDLHLGADTSLLTEVDPLCTEPDPSVPSDVLLALRDCLRSLLSSQGRDKPTLILLGDPTAMQAAVKQLTGQQKTYNGA
jgi:hypothetical protein